MVSTGRENGIKTGAFCETSEGVGYSAPEWWQVTGYHRRNIVAMLQDNLASIDSYMKEAIHEVFDFLRLPGWIGVQE